MATRQQGTDRQRESSGPEVVDDRIGMSYGGFPIFKVSRKLYRCRVCKGEFETDTNHFGPIYTCQSSDRVFACRTGPSDCRELDFDILIKKLERELGVTQCVTGESNE
jgi:hypothetical protein